jgi:hypothetical protein
MSPGPSMRAPLSRARNRSLEPVVSRFFGRIVLRCSHRITPRDSRQRHARTSGDQLNPTRVKPDLTKLTDEELGQLEKIVLKVGTGASGGPDGNAG